MHSWHLFVVRLGDAATIGRDAFIERMFAVGIGCSVHYVPLHLQPYWRDRYGLTPEQFPASQRAYERLVSLPMYSRMSEADVARVATAAQAALAEPVRLYPRDAERQEEAVTDFWGYLLAGERELSCTAWGNPSAQHPQGAAARAHIETAGKRLSALGEKDEGWWEAVVAFFEVQRSRAWVMTRRIAREEGIFAGNSAGSAMAGLLQLRDRFTKDDVVVVIFHDHGSRYLAKMFNDEWMRAKGFLEVSGMTARDLVALGVSGELHAVEAARPIEDAIRIMSDHDFSQISVTRDGRVVGSLNESHLYNEFVRHPEIKRKPVESIMQPAFPFADISTPVELLSTMITHESPAVLVRDFKTEKTFIITKSDMIRVLM